MKDDNSKVYHKSKMGNLILLADQFGLHDASGNTIVLYTQLPKDDNNLNASPPYADTSGRTTSTIISVQREDNQNPSVAYTDGVKACPSAIMTEENNNHIENGFYVVPVQPVAPKTQSDSNSVLETQGPITVNSLSVEKKTSSTLANSDQADNTVTDAVPDLTCRDFEDGSPDHKPLLEHFLSQGHTRSIQPDTGDNFEVTDPLDIVAMESEEDILSQWDLQKDDEECVTVPDPSWPVTKQYQTDVRNPTNCNKNGLSNEELQSQPPDTVVELYKIAMAERQERIKNAPMITCPDCHMQFSKQFKYRLHHLQMHPSEGEKRFKCERCGKKYNHIQSLKTHQRKHRSCQSPSIRLHWMRYAKRNSEGEAKGKGPKYHGCPGCGRPFNRLFNLRRHTKKCLHYFAKEQCDKLPQRSRVNVEKDEQNVHPHLKGKSGGNSALRPMEPKAQGHNNAKQVKVQRYDSPVKESRKLGSPRGKTYTLSALKEHLQRSKEGRLTKSMSEYLQVYTQQNESNLQNNPDCVDTEDQSPEASEPQMITCAFCQSFCGESYLDLWHHHKDCASVPSVVHYGEKGTVLQYQGKTMGEEGGRSISSKGYSKRIAATRGREDVTKASFPNILRHLGQNIMGN